MGHQNFFATRLTTDIGASDTTITLETAPTETSGRLVLEARNPTQREIIKYTGVAGNDITGVTRGEGGTSAKTHTRNALVEMNLTAEDIQDLYDAYDSFVASNANGWVDLLSAPNTVTALGNRSYSMVFNGVDHTDLISPGMRLKLTRTVTAPTQCADLESGSSHYFNKTSPSGMTFTDDFTVSAWVKLESYTGGAQTIASRYNGTSGWALEVQSSGQVAIIGWNNNSANYSQILSAQSVPLNRWVHIAAQLDMSAFTATTTTSYVMIDGVNVPGTVSRGGTSPTALIQAGNLEIGSKNAGSFFDGKIAQVAIYSAKVTQANILATMAQGLTGSETSLISAYSFNNTLNDLSANANNLTAQNSAVATATDSPFAGGSVGTTEYGIVTAATFSTDTTLTVQVPEGGAIPTTGGVSAISYSIMKSPFGFPLDPDKWTVTTINSTDASQSSPTNGTWYNLGSINISIPTGVWSVRYQASLYITKAASTDLRAALTLSTSNSSESDSDLTSFQQIGGASGTLTLATHMNKNKIMTTTAATVYYLNAKSLVGSASNLVVIGSSGHPTRITATCAYL